LRLRRGVSAYTIRVIPLSLVRFGVRCLILALYRVRVLGEGHVPAQGGALLVSNHVSLMDGFLVGWAARHRHVRFMIWRPYYDHWALRGVLHALRTIPVNLGGPRAMTAAIQSARRELEAGHVVCIFAEGSVTRTGNLLPFKRGMEKIAEGLDVPVIPVHLDRVWHSIFSFAGGNFFGKTPRRWPYHVTVSIGAPLPQPATAGAARQAVQELGSEAAQLAKEPGATLPARFVGLARRHWGKLAMADSTGRELTYGRTLVAALLLSGEIRRRTGSNKMIGLLLPATVGGALANLGVSLAGKVPVNLNFTGGRESMAYTAAQCEIRTVITSKVFLAKAKLEAPAGAVYLEDIMAGLTKAQKLLALVKARLAPASWLTPKGDPDSLATVIFSSGSTGVPKGIMLSHFNLATNVDAVLQIFSLDERDRIIGVLPLFHSFGFMATIWLPLFAGAAVVYHPNPTDAKVIGELIHKYKGTFLLSTPTFCGTYMRKCTREQFASLRFVVVGAEKLREPLRQEFEETFGIDLLEGYGMTEMSPVVAVNTPGFREGKEIQVGTKHGTVGLPIPGVAVRIVDPETMQPLLPGQDGMLLVKGPNRMLGYLNQPERTAQALHDGWYITGDIAKIDEDGFLSITDRLSRFSKVGGEMVPHLLVEELIRKACGDSPCAVTGLPDERKGERLAVLYTDPDITPEELWRRLSETDLPKLWLPKLENIHQVDELPVLGTGKLDLRGVRARALELASAPTEPRVK
jgi:acyl-[acyl-carrier-protein]-phospholipid O-acyltransferase / long-chain-fatty-acid--[acyl-carrier-protein] ligase